METLMQAVTSAGAPPWAAVGGDDAPRRALWAAVRRWVDTRTAGLEESVRREHALTETLRRALVAPAAAAATFGDMAVEAACAPWDAAARVGGDFYDAFRLDADRVALVVGDVCGKGAAAAAQVPPVRWGLRALLRDDPSPGSALTRLNDALCREQALPPPAPAVPSGVALTVAVVDTGRGTARCAVAGAEPPLLRRAGGEARPLAAAGALLGVVPGFRYADSPLALAPGDLLLMVTDGVTEARRGWDFLGVDGVARLAAAAGGRPVAQAVLDGARAFAGGLLHDDACVLTARRVGGGA